jgi:hypothetical protein
MKKLGIDRPRTECFDGRLTTLADRMKEMNYTQPPYSEKYPELLTLYNDDPARPKYNRIRRNISVGGRWLDLYSGLDLSLLEIKDNLIADPVIFRTSAETGVETENFAEFPQENAAVAEKFAQLGNKIIDGIGGQNTAFHCRTDSFFQLFGRQAGGVANDERIAQLPSLNVLPEIIMIALRLKRIVSERREPCQALNKMIPMLANGFPA